MRDSGDGYGRVIEMKTGDVFYIGPDTTVGCGSRAIRVVAFYGAEKYAAGKK